MAIGSEEGVMLLSMAALLLQWALGYALVAGVGLPVARRLAWRGGVELCSAAFWSGFALLIAALSVWHLWLPVNGWAIALAAAWGGFGLWRDALKRSWRGWRGPSPGAWALGALLLLYLLFLANRALSGIVTPDAFDYQLPLLRWTQDYAIIPGLSNLNLRAGLNHSYYLFLALFDLPGSPFGAHNIVPGLMMGALMLQLSAAALRVWRRVGRRSDVMATLLLAPMLFQSLYFLSSPSNDAPVFFLALLLALHSARVLLGEIPRQLLSMQIGWILALAVTAISCKMTVALFLGLLSVALLLRLARAQRIPLARKAWVVVPAGLLAALWMGRGMILNGYPLAPLTVGAVGEISWRVPHDYMTFAMAWHKAWTRNPHVSSPDQDVQDWSWLKPWWKRLISASASRYNFPNYHDFSALILLPLLLAAALALRWRRLWRGCRFAAWALLFASGAALAHWFLNGPLPRYMGAMAWALPALLTAALVGGAPRSRLRARGVVLAALALGVACMGMKLSHPTVWPLVPPPPGFGAEPLVRDKPYMTVRTDQGAVVNMPRYNQVCEGVPHPCSATIHPWLAQRDPNTLQAGFVLRPPAGLTWADDPIGRPYFYKSFESLLQIWSSENAESRRH
ncbi:LIC_10190 family membrane protein [Magnetofaba australis]|uniref:Putative cytoplasmic membrane protein n=1 Tax=Magnetofaba australis IT-1 TaxID=1434232 RepID=A0A1Y2K5K7_9PROT|nr:hypothetical protein [Magnetofaba australis]OSM04909.1 putative cytoplasmic membrane protein [Magnetofaba australis IT-1]